MSIAKKIIFFSFICSTLAFLAFLGNSRTALAQQTATPWLDKVNEGGLNAIGRTAYDTTSPKDVRLVVIDALKIILGLLGIIMVIIIAIAGFRWMTSQGNEEKISKAQKTISSAAIGLLIILASLSIAMFISNRIIRATGQNVPTLHLGETVI